MISEKESTARWVKREKTRKVEARIAKKLEKKRVASLTQEELEAEAEAEVKATLKAEERARREGIGIEEYLRREEEKAGIEAEKKAIEHEKWLIPHEVWKKGQAEKKRIKKLKECPSTDEVRKFRVKLDYKLLSEDTLIAIIKHFERAKENGTLQKAKKEIRSLNLKYKEVYKFEYELEIKLKCSTTEKERVEIQAEIENRAKLLLESIDKLEQDELLERILNFKSSRDDDASLSEFSEERGRKIHYAEYKTLTSFMFKNNTTNEIVLKLEENLEVSSLTSYIRYRSNEVYSLDDKSKTIINLSELEELNVLYSNATASEKIEIGKMKTKLKNELRKNRKGGGNYSDTHRISEIEKVNDIKLRKAELELYRYEYFHKYGVYPPERFKGTANDIIYLWKNQDGVYKIGVTSKRAGKSRIWKVAREGHMKAEIIYYEEVEDAILVENQLLKCGTKVHFKYKFDGSTEFRYLSEDDLEKVTNIIQKHKIGV